MISVILYFLYSYVDYFELNSKLMQPSVDVSEHSQRRLVGRPHLLRHLPPLHAQHQQVRSTSSLILWIVTYTNCMIISFSI